MVTANYTVKSIKTITITSILIIFHEAYGSYCLDLAYDSAHMIADQLRSK